MCISIFLLLIFACFSPTFAGETLEDAWNIAIHESRQLKSQRAGTAAAEADLDTAFATKMPKVKNTTLYTAITPTPEISLEFPGTAASIETPIIGNHLLVSSTLVTVPLYMGGKTQSLMDQAQARVRASESGEITSLQDLKMNVADNYFLVLRLQGMIEVMEDSEKALASHEKNVEKMLKTGVATRNAYLSAQVAHADAQQKTMQARNTLLIAESAYNRYLWRPLDTPVELEQRNIPPSAGNLEGYILTAISQRSELRRLSAESRAMQAQAKEYRSDRLPHLTATGGYTHLQTERLAENNFWSGSVGMTWTPFDGGASRSRQRSAEMRAVAIMNTREDMKSAIELEVRRNWLEEQDSRRRVVVAQKAIEQAEENLRVVDKRFRQGLSTHTEVLDAVTLYTQARTNYCNAAYDAILATYRLRRATGGL